MCYISHQKFNVLKAHFVLHIFFHTIFEHISSLVLLQKSDLAPEARYHNKSNVFMYSLIWLFRPNTSEKLGFIGCDRVGIIPGPRLKRHAIYRVADVVLVPLVPPNLVPGDVPLSHQLGLKPCPKHHGGKQNLHFKIAPPSCHLLIEERTIQLSILTNKKVF